MATKSISQLDSASTMALGDLLEIAEPNAQSVSGYTSKKISIGSQLAPYIQGTVQNASLNTTDKTLVGAINEEEAKKVSWNDYSEYGVKNLIPYPWYHPNGRENRGITFTFDGEGYISLDGTASQTQAPFYSYSSLRALIPLILESGKEYILSVERLDDRIYAAIFFYNSEGAGLNCNLNAEFEDGSTRIDQNATSLSLNYNNITHSKAKFTVTANTTIYIQADLRVPANSGYFDPQDAKGRVMLRDANITDDTWKRFGGSNVQLSSLITDFMSIFASIETTSNAHIQYSVGDYMFWKGGFYKVTTAISAGGAITEGTNVTQTTIGAELKAALNA